MLLCTFDTNDRVTWIFSSVVIYKSTETYDEDRKMKAKQEVIYYKVVVKEIPNKRRENWRRSVGQWRNMSVVYTNDMLVFTCIFIGGVIYESTETYDEDREMKAK